MKLGRQVQMFSTLLYAPGFQSLCQHNIYIRSLSKEANKEALNVNPSGMGFKNNINMYQKKTSSQCKVEMNTKAGSWEVPCSYNPHSGACEVIDLSVCAVQSLLTAAPSTVWPSAPPLPTQKPPLHALVDVLMKGCKCPVAE